MELLIFLAADFANIDRAGKLNVLGAFNQIAAKEFPARHHAMHLVIKLAAELGERSDTRKLGVKLMSQDAEVLLSFSTDFQVPASVGGRTPEFNAVLEFRDLVFPAPGRYEFKLLVDKDVKGSLPLDVTKLAA